MYLEGWRVEGEVLALKCDGGSNCVYETYTGYKVTISYSVWRSEEGICVDANSAAYGTNAIAGMYLNTPPSVSEIL